MCGRAGDGEIGVARGEAIASAGDPEPGASGADRRHDQATASSDYAKAAVGDRPMSDDAATSSATTVASTDAPASAPPPLRTPTPADFAISTTQLTKRYGSLTALDSLDLHLSKGDVFGFIGPNGAGKSTTMKILAG